MLLPEKSHYGCHFAQTLDGKIATTSGHFKWIGNDENLRHAHRMRALYDAILEGRGTVKFDKPKLTVRLVPGKNPHRVILGNTCEDFSSFIETYPENITADGKRLDGKFLSDSMTIVVQIFLYD